MPPKAVFMRFSGAINKIIDRKYLKYRLNAFTEVNFLKRLSVATLDDLLARIELIKHPCQTGHFTQEWLKNNYPNEDNRVISQAKRIISGELSLLGFKSKNISNIDWHTDCKSNISWPYVFFSDINTLDLDRDSDVKIPWEISRLQWIVPVVQAWIITKDEQYSEYVKGVIVNWVKHNTYSMGVNWACTMEPAMRVFTWTWIYQVLSKSTAWDDSEFKLLFLKNLYLHLLYIRRYIEITDVNGNHLLANSAALVVGGVFFGDAQEPYQWRKLGLSILENEIVQQVYDDGVDFEGSIPYHRFATELFFFPAVYYELNYKAVTPAYRRRVIKMAEYIRAYTKPDGTAPVFGDSDDGRVLPLGDQEINDHRYLYNIIGSIWTEDNLIFDWYESGSEIFWWRCEKSKKSISAVPSAIFRSGGSYIMRSNDDYIFIDCGPLGLKNRGGHGHNDCLSFEATLCGVNIICDSGSYTYTSDYKKRNYYRSTASHNTPMIANQEINRFIDEKNIWFLHGDAESVLLDWSDSNDHIIFKGTHTGYERLQPSVKPIRTILLDKVSHAFVIHDEFTLQVEHEVKIPLHFSAEITIKRINSNSILLISNEKEFILDWDEDINWIMSEELYEISKSYGVKEKSLRLIWNSKCGCKEPLTIYVYPNNSSSETCYIKLKKMLKRYLE